MHISGKQALELYDSLVSTDFPPGARVAFASERASTLRIHKRADGLLGVTIVLENDLALLFIDLTSEQTSKMIALLHAGLVAPSVER